MTFKKLRDRRPNYQDTLLYQFGEKFTTHLEQPFTEQYKDLHALSIDQNEAFWDFWLDHSGLICDKGVEILAPRQPGTYGARFFRDTYLNYAENQLENYESDDQIALVYRDHLPNSRRELTVQQVKSAVSIYAQLLQQAGVTHGDRVAAYIGNTPEAACFALAAGYLGAVFSIIGPGNEAKSVLDRFSQIDPTVLVCTDEDFESASGVVDRLKTSCEIANTLPNVKQVIVTQRYRGQDQKDLSEFDAPAAYLADLQRGVDAAPLTYKRYAFNDPLFILYSSGTSGNPKCITHGIGGTLLEHLKEHKLHADVKPGDIAFFQTNSEWMMWHYNLSQMACGATVVLSDLNVKHENLNVLFRIAHEEKVTVLGSFAGFFNTLQRRNFSPIPADALASVRQIQSTGSRLLPETFSYMYDAWNLQGEIASVSGGTDIVGCFVHGCPIGAVYEGVSQAITLGYDLRAFDTNGQELPAYEAGELVCCQPFPNMPVKFWGDETGTRYKDAYFEAEDAIWRHGDEMLITEEKGMVVLGRSDETLNINGNRIGPIEIMTLVQKVDGIQEAAVVGRNIKGSDYPVLFVVLDEGAVLDGLMKQQIATQILAEKPAFCVPPSNYIFAIPGLPRAGVKLSLIALKKIVNGRDFTGKEKMTPENQRYLTAVEQLNVCEAEPSREKIAS